MQASDAGIGVLDRPVGADGATETLGRGLGAEQTIAGVNAFPAIGETPLGDQRVVAALGHDRRRRPALRMQRAVTVRPFTSTSSSRAFLGTAGQVSRRFKPELRSRLGGMDLGPPPSAGLLCRLRVFSSGLPCVLQRR